MGNSKAFPINIVVPFLGGAVAAIVVHYVLDIRYLENVVRNGGSAGEPATVWTLFLYRAIVVFLLSLFPPLLVATRASWRVGISFATGIASAYAVLAVIPPTNLWPFSLVMAVVLAGGPALAGGALVHYLKQLKQTG